MTADRPITVSSLKSASDEWLMLAIRRKNLAALEELYDRYHRLSLAVAFRVLGNASTSEDAVQDAFMAVWEKPDSFTPERGAARSWLLSVVRHRAIDVTRKRSYSEETMSPGDPTLDSQPADVWRQVTQRLDGQRVRQAVDSLPAEQRDAVMMAYFEGYTYQEVAQRTGVPLGTVKGRMRLGMRKLRGLLWEKD